MRILFALIPPVLILVCSVAHAEDPVFQDNPFFVFDWQDNLTAGIELADVDGDGDLDALVANGRHWAQQDFVYINYGDGRLTEARRLGEDMGPSYIVKAGDCDRDGDVDAVVIRDRLPAQVFRNDGAGRFSYLADIENSAGNSRSAAIADLTNDGVPDLVIANRRGPETLFRGNADCWFDYAGVLPGDEGASTGISVGDLNDDGLPDLVLARRDGDQSAVMLNLGEGHFRALPIAETAGDHRTVAIADFDLDGVPDIALGSMNGNTRLMRGDGRGVFSDWQMLGAGGRVIQALVAADIDMDGDADLIEGAEESHNVVWINNGAVGFHQIMLDDDEEDTYGVAVGDMTGDGKPDLVFANSGAPNLIMRAR